MKSAIILKNGSYNNERRRIFSDNVRILCALLKKKKKKKKSNEGGYKSFDINISANCGIELYV